MTRDEVVRYEVFDDLYGDTQAEAVPDGEWVRYEDHAKALAAMKAERDMLACILAALREPSEAVISKVWEEIIVQCTLQTHDPKSGKPLKDWICHEVTEKEVPLVIRAAVEAAEQEASA